MRSFLFRLALLLGSLLVIVALLIGFLPTIASTDWGREKVVGWLNRSIPGQVEIHALHLHWGKGQVAEGILLKDPEGQSVLEMERLATEATLWQLIKKSTHLGFTQIQELNAAIVTDEQGLTNLQRALGFELNQDTPRLLASTIVLSHVNANLYLFAENKPLSVFLKGLTRQENLAGSFEVNLALSGLQANNWEELKQDAEKYLSIEGSKEAQLQARIVNFPVDLIDRLVALKNPTLNGFFRSLLGDRLNLNLDKEPNPEGLAFHLTTQSPFMQGALKGQIKQGIFTLQEPASFNFQLTPQSVNPFTHYRFELLDTTLLKFVFQELNLPLSFFDDKVPVDPCQLSFKAQATLPTTLLDVYPVGEVKILNLQALLESAKCDKTVHMHVTGQAQQGSEPFDLKWDSLLNKPVHLSNLVQELRKNMTSTLSISHFPLKLIPALQENPLWVQQVGSYADMQLNLNQTPKEEWVLNVAAQTPKLTLSQAQFRIDKELVLISPFNVQWSMSPDCLKALFNETRLQTEQTCLVNLAVKRLQVPLDGSLSGKVQLESTIPLLRFTDIIPDNIIQFKDIVIKANGQNLIDFSSQLTGQLSVLTQKGDNSPLMARPLDILADANWKKMANQPLEMPMGRLTWKSPLAEGKIEGRLFSDGSVALTQPALIKQILTPEAWQALSVLLKQKEPQLQQPAVLNLTIEPTMVKQMNALLNSMRAKGLLTIDQLVFKSTPQQQLPLLKNLELPWNIEAPSNTFSANLTGTAYANPQAKPSPLAARLLVNHWLENNQWNLEHAAAEIQIDLTNLPTSVFSLFTNQDFATLLGPVMDVDLKTRIDRDKQAPGYWDMNIDSAAFHAKARLKFDQAITLYDSTNASAEIRWTLSPEGYNFLKNQWQLTTPLTLAAPVTLSGYLSQLYIPLQTQWTQQGKIAGYLATNDIQWKDQAAVPLKWEGHFGSQNLAEQLNFDLQALSGSMPLKMQGNISNLLDAQGELHSWQQMGIQAQVQGKQLSPAFIQSLFLMDPAQQQKVQALFGEAIAVDLNCELAQLTGPLNASIKGDNGNVHLEGELTKGVLTLRTPLTGSIKVTPLLSQVFLAKTVPMLSKALGAEAPIQLTVSPRQFSCPLVPFQLNQVVVGEGTLDLGKIRFQNTGDLRSILNFIRPLTDQQLTIWFTPLYFQLNQGLFSFKRMDLLLAHAYTLASWGKIDLITEQTSLILGLTAQTLRDTFGIQGLAQDYLLQVPLYSRQGKIEIDQKKALGRISALIAQMKVGESNKFVGNLFDAVFSEPTDRTPPPTTQPFPWAQEFDSSPPAPQPQQQQEANENTLDTGNEAEDVPDAKSSKSKKKHKKHLKDHIQEGASQVLDKWLGQ